MRWIRAIQRWGSLGVAVTAVAGIGIASKQWAERHYLALLLGPHAESSGVELYPRHSVACAKDVQVPLTLTDNPASAQAAQLCADQLWFSFESSEILRKRLVLPSVAAKNTRIKTSKISFATAPQHSSAESATAWLKQLQVASQTVNDDQFVAGKQVCVDCDLMIDHWQEGFNSVVSRSQRLLAEAQDQRQQLMLIVNPLREEKRIIEHVQRLEQISLELETLIVGLTKSDKPLSDQQSSLREAMLREKKDIIAKGAAFTAPTADGLAQFIIRSWIESHSFQPIEYTQLLAQFLVQPFHVQSNDWGKTIRHAEYPQPEITCSTVKLSGEIETSLASAMFKATGQFAIMPDQTISTSLPCGDSAGWEFQIYEGDKHYLLKGRTLNARAGHSQIQLFSASESAPAAMSLQCAFDQTELKGSGQLTLGHDARKTGVLPNFADVDAQTRAANLWNSYLSQSPELPTKIDFQVSGTGQALNVTLDPQQTAWLADGLAKQASRQLEQLYQQAAAKLEQRVREKLDDMSHQIANSKDDTLQRLKLARHELELVKEATMRQIADWSRGQFAGQSTEATIR